LPSEVGLLENVLVSPLMPEPVEMVVFAHPLAKEPLENVVVFPLTANPRENIVVSPVLGEQQLD